MNKSKLFLNKGILTRTDEKIIDRIALDYLNDFSRKNRYRIKLDSSLVDSEIERNEKWINHLKNKNCLTKSKQFEIIWDIKIEVAKNNKLKELQSNN